MKNQSDKDIQLNVEDNGELNFKVDKKKKTIISNSSGSSVDFGSKLVSIFIALVLIGAVLFFAYRVIPDNIIANTDEVKASREREESEKKASEEAKSLANLLEEENGRLFFTDQTVALNFKDYGTVKFDLKDKAAPKTVENFVRLVDRDYFDNTNIFRTVESPSVNFLKGGDPTGIGTGGETANGEELLDEIWLVPPEYNTVTNENGESVSELVNEPVFTDESLYPNYDRLTNQVTFPKGYLFMGDESNVGSSTTSQFFITTDITTVPASYTVFGVVEDDESKSTLDKIKDETDPPEPPEGSERRDGFPDKEIKIESAELL